MKRQYIDFVPVKKSADPVERILPTVKAKSTTEQTKTTTVVYASPRPNSAPLSNPDLKTLKGTKLSSVKHIYATPKPATPPVNPKKPTPNTLNIPQANFINQEKIVKRPLSKNVYIRELEQKTAEDPEALPEESKIIISEPKKKSKAGIIIAIIITIILGALAGTAAFFLLPK